MDDRKRKRGATFLEYALLAALIGIAAPCIDETIQLFVPERVGALGDVLIDMAGFALATAICLLVSRTQRSRSQSGQLP